jgi:Zn-dependent protease
MHWTVLLSFAWMYLVFMDVVPMLVSIPFLFLIFAVHELGHVVVLRRRKIAVTGVSLWGIHGETSYNEYAAKPGDVVAVAWGGVAAQVLLMLAALAITETGVLTAIPFGGMLGMVMFVVLVKLNIFLMIVALLPIGPFDGHAAWQVIRRTRAKMKAKAPARPKPAPPPQPEVRMSEEQQRELDQTAARETADLIKKLTGKSDANR